MKVVKPQCLVFQAAPLQIGDHTSLQTAAGVGFRLSDPRILVHEAEVWSALAKSGAPHHLHLQTLPKPFAEWLLLGHATHRTQDLGQAQVEWVASVHVGAAKKVISCQQQAQTGLRSDGLLSVALKVDHANSHHGAHCQNPVGVKELNPPLQLATATGWSADPWAAMGPLDPAWSVRRQFLPRGSGVASELGNAKRGPGAWPTDIDRRYFQQSSPAQWTRSATWAADAAFELVGFGPTGSGYVGQLPGITVRQFDASLADPRQSQEREMALKTVLFLPDQDLGLMWWQSSLPLAYATQDVPVLMTLAVDLMQPVRPAQEIVGYAQRRIDPTDHDPAVMSDVSLMPPLASGRVWELIVEAEDHPRFDPPQRDFVTVQGRLTDLEQQMVQARQAKEDAERRYQSLATSVQLPEPPPAPPGGPSWRQILQGPVRPELMEGVTLREEDLSGLNLAGWSMKRVRFERCNLRATQWKSCHLEDVSFAHCDFNSVSMGNVNVHRGKWDHCQMASLTVHGGKWQQVEWTDCQAEALSAVDVHWQQLTMNRSAGAAWNIQGADIQRWAVAGGDAPRWRVASSKLAELLLSDVNLSSLHLHKTAVNDLSAVRTTFEGALFEGCRLTKAVLALGCVLDFSSLEDCVWQQSTWSGISASALTAHYCAFPNFCAAGCKLESSQWRRCDLSSADFSNALLHGAVFEQSSLRDAALLGTDFGSGEVQGCNLVGARLQWATVQAGSRWRDNLDAGSQIHPRRSA